MKVKNPKTGRLILVGGPTWKTLTPLQQKRALEKNPKTPTSPKKAPAKSTKTPKKIVKKTPKKASPKSPKASPKSPKASPKSPKASPKSPSPKKASPKSPGSPKKTRTAQQKAWDDYQRDNPDEYKKFVYLAHLGLDLPIMQEIKMEMTATKVRSLYQKILNSGVEWEPKRETSRGGYFKYRYFSPGNKYWTLILQTESDPNSRESITPNYSKAQSLGLTRKNRTGTKMIHFGWHIPKNEFVKDIAYGSRTKLTEAAFKQEIDKELAMMKKTK